MDKFSKILVSAAAASVLASGAMASGLVFGKTQDNTSPVTAVDANKTIADLSAKSDNRVAVQIDELLKGSDLTINVLDTSEWKGAGTKNSRLLAYWSDVKLAKESTLKFKINCGEIAKDTEIKLYAINNNDTNASNVTMRSFVRVGFLEDYETGEDGYKWILMKVDSDFIDFNFTTKDGGIEKVDDSDGKIPANVALFFASDADDGHLKVLKFIPKKGDSCGCVCDTSIEMVSAQNKNGQALNAPITTDKPKILTYVPGFSAKVQHLYRSNLVDGYATSEINTATGVDRKKFVDENLTNGKGDTSPLKSQFSIALTNSAEYGLSLDDTDDKFTLNVNRAIGCAVDKVSLSTKLGSKKTTDLTKDTTASKPSFTLKDAKFAEYNLSSDNNITISVNGTDVICPGMWRVSLEIKPDESGVEPFKVLDVANAADWRIRAMQFIIPYLNTDPNYGTYIVITNMGDNAADVLVDVYGDSGKNEGQATSAYYTNIKLSPIPRRSTRIYFPRDLNNAIKAKFPAWNANRYMAKFYVLAEENNIEAAAFQKDGNNGKRSIPVLTQAYHWEGNSTNGSYKGHFFHE